MLICGWKMLICWGIFWFSDSKILIFELFDEWVVVIVLVLLKLLLKVVGGFRGV